MTVECGFGGQKFQEQVLTKVRWLAGVLLTCFHTCRRQQHQLTNNQRLCLESTANFLPLLRPSLPPLLPSLLLPPPQVKQLRASFPSLNIQVDGGVNRDAARLAAAAGANVLVAGTAVFGAPDGPAAAISALRSALVQEGLAAAAGSAAAKAAVAV